MRFLRTMWAGALIVGTVGVIVSAANGVANWGALLMVGWAAMVTDDVLDTDGGGR